MSAIGLRCDIDDCNRPHKARGWCSAHYQRWSRHGDPLADLGFRRSLPAAPLLDAIDAGCATSDTGAARWMLNHGFHERNIWRWKQTGRVDLDTADRVSDALGLHPSELWGDEYYAPLGTEA